MKLTKEQLVELGGSSPFYKLLNIRIEEIKANYARLSISIDERHTQLLETVHGGVIASLIDSAAAWAIYGSDANLKGIPVTVEMKVNFLRPIKSGKLVAEARNLHEGSRIFVSDVEVKDNKEKLIAKALVTYYVVEESQKQYQILTKSVN